jgi:hypothetical protein
MMEATKLLDVGLPTEDSTVVVRYHSHRYGYSNCELRVQGESDTGIFSHWLQLQSLSPLLTVNEKTIGPLLSTVEMDTVTKRRLPNCHSLSPCGIKSQSTFVPSGGQEILSVLHKLRLSHFLPQFQRPLDQDLRLSPCSFEAQGSQ